MFSSPRWGCMKRQWVYGYAEKEEVDFLRRNCIFKGKEPDVKGFFVFKNKEECKNPVEVKVSIEIQQTLHPSK